MAQKGSQLKGALASDPKKREKPVERLSPGVYRSKSGNLVSPKGRVLPHQQAFQQGRQMQPWAQYQDFQNIANQMGQNLGNSVTYPQDMRNVADQMGQRMGMMPATDWQSQVYVMNPNNTPGFQQQYQPSANHGGQYRLSPGVYGTQEQAFNQYMTDGRNDIFRAMQPSAQPDVSKEQPQQQSDGNWARNQVTGQWELTKAHIDPRVAWNPRNRVNAIGNRLRKVF